MTAKNIVDILLGEATVRRPPRGRRWIAVFSGPEPYQQVWKSTGLKNKRQALALAKKWEAEARGHRQQQAAKVPNGPRLRVRTRGPEGVRLGGGLTQQEVASILQISERAVRNIERRALAKLRSHPALREIWEQWQALSGLGESGPAVLPSQSGPHGTDLSRAEIQAVLGLARNKVELLAVYKMLRIASLVP